MLRTLYALRAPASMLGMTDHPWSASHFFYKVRPCTLPKGQLKLFHIYRVNIGQQPKEVTKKGGHPESFYSCASCLTLVVKTRNVGCLGFWVLTRP
jgi:hypothetical protein